MDKPAGYASIPSILHTNTIANFVKYYYLKKDYPNKQIHIVTRLDKDTSGLMLLAKHGYAHARLDKQLQKKTIKNGIMRLFLDKGNCLIKERSSLLLQDRKIVSLHAVFTLLVNMHIQVIKY